MSVDVRACVCVCVQVWVCWSQPVFLSVSISFPPDHRTEDINLLCNSIGHLKFSWFVSQFVCMVIFWLWFWNLLSLVGRVKSEIRWQLRFGFITRSLLSPITIFALFQSGYTNTWLSYCDQYTQSEAPLALVAALCGAVVVAAAVAVAIAV